MHQLKKKTWFKHGAFSCEKSGLIPLMENIIRSCVYECTSLNMWNEQWDFGNILQNVSVCVLWKRESYAGLDLHGGEYMLTEFTFPE